MFRTTGMSLMILVLLLSSVSTLAQKRKKTNASHPAPTSEADRWQSYQQRLLLQKQSMLTGVPFRNVGPTIMSGRVADLEVDPDDPSHFYVAYASGGLWETTNEGASFEPLFDDQIVMSIGDIAVDWQNNIIYVGTGENNSSRSSYSGYGIFRSADNGRSWDHLGLPESHHIGRVILHPDNPNIIWVASLGHLYSNNTQRGIYKSVDGGSTWTKTLYINDRTGIIELVINPENPDHLIAAAWQKDRKAWNFEESGEGTGLYKSTDGGESWINISEGDSGFPDTEGSGRIGLTYVDNQTLFAVVDNQDRREKSSEDLKKVTKELLKSISAIDFDTLDNADINDFLDRHAFPADINAVDLKADIQSGQLKPVDLVYYLEDANAQLFDTQVIGGEVYRSDDGGMSWVKTHEGSIEDFIFSYGYYFGQIRHDPTSPDNLYILGVPILTSPDGGKTWKNINGENVHVDHHALWVNPDKPGHLILGNDGGIHISKDNGTTWVKCNSAPLGQFYSVNVDMDKPYNVYGGLQDNGVWKGPGNYTYSRSWYGEGRYPYERVMGGDGMQVQIDPRDNRTIYTGFQFGNYFRIDLNTKQQKRITPMHKLGERPLRWNWQSPILLSTHNPDIVYFASNYFHRSLDQGEHFDKLSGDLTKGGRKGDVPYGTVTTLSESPLRFGLIYAGTDDGLVHVSRDVGYTWTQITDGLPPNYWVSRIYASHHEEGRVYLALNGYRWDDFTAMIYVSDDYGQSWRAIGHDLPDEPVNVIKEDPVNEDLLYVGTDHGLYASLDRGGHFMTLGNLPAVAVHDLVVHPRDHELVVGTHGRSIYIGQVEHLQQLTPDKLGKGDQIFSLSTPTYSDRWGQSWWTWGEPYQPSVDIPYFTLEGDSVTLSVRSGDLILQSRKLAINKGLNYLTYDLTLDDALVDEYTASLEEKYSKDFKKAENGQWYLRPGKYKVIISNRGKVSEAELEVKAPKERPKRKG